MLNAVATFLPVSQGILVFYGNPDGQDVDLFAAVPKIQGELKGLTLEDLDLLVMSVTKCESLIPLFDTTVTEPLRTGILLAGDDALWARLRTDLDSAEPTDKSFSYLFQTGIAQYQSSLAWLERFARTKDVDDAGFCLSNLSFACTSMLTAKELAAGKPAPLMSDLITQHRLLRTCREKFSEIKRGAQINRHTLDILTADWEKEMLL